MSDTALVTGASAGIGRALAREFAAHGHDVVLVARREERLRSLAADVEADHGITATPLPMDLDTSGAPAALLDAVADRGLDVGILVNNVGVGVHGEFGETDRAAELTQLRLDVTVLVELTHRFLDGRDSGTVLNVGSVAGFVPGPYMAGYYASKAYVNRFSEALAAEHHDDDIDVTVVCPGPVDTEFHERAGVDDSSISEWISYSPETVAGAAYEGMAAGRAVVIPGLAMKVIALLARVSPGFLRRWGGRKVLRER